MWRVLDAPRNREPEEYWEAAGHLVNLVVKGEM
jgi:hypothetical protein